MARAPCSVHEREGVLCAPPTRAACRARATYTRVQHASVAARSSMRRPSRKGGPLSFHQKARRQTSWGDSEGSGQRKNGEYDGWHGHHADEKETNPAQKGRSDFCKEVEHTLVEELADLIC